MKMTRPLASAAGALLLVSGAASLALLGGGNAVAAGQPSSAFGLELTGAGNSVIPKTPSVTSTNGTLVQDSLIALPSNPIVSGGLINASAQNGNAVASVSNVAVGDGLLSQLGTAVTGPLSDTCNQLSTALAPLTDPLDPVVSGLLGQLDGLLSTIGTSASGSGGIDLSLLDGINLTGLTKVQLLGLCDILAGNAKVVGADAVIAECNGTTGTTKVTNLKALGLPVDIDVTKPNSSVSIPGLATVTANRQTQNADGTFTVDALYVELLGQIRLTVASATCGNVSSDTSSQGTSDAPTPTPTETNVPVTG